MLDVIRNIYYKPWSVSQSARGRKPVNLTKKIMNFIIFTHFTVHFICVCGCNINSAYVSDNSVIVLRQLFTCASCSMIAFAFYAAWAAATDNIERNATKSLCFVFLDSTKKKQKQTLKKKKTKHKSTWGLRILNCVGESDVHVRGNTSVFVFHSFRSMLR